MAERNVVPANANWKRQLEMKLMRKIVIALLGLVAAFVTTIEPSHAQNRAWCTQGRVGSWGFPYCAYDTFAQCQAAASGLGRSCTQNYSYEPPAKRKKRTRGQG
jgi:hypothetical protein